jgi:DNA-binding transcriptional LysR family regulator
LYGGWAKIGGIFAPKGLGGSLRHFVLNDMHLLIDAALHGAGLAIVMEDMVAPFIADGRLVRVLEDWSPPFSGYHLYYPNRRHPSPAFAALLEELRADSHL